MDELTTIEELAEKAEAAFPYKLVETLQKENEELKAKVTHLEGLLSANTKLLDSGGFEVTSEQAICEMQIKRIREKATDRELTLEEAKKLEILVKALYLIKERGAGSEKPDWALPAGTSIANLAQIAASPEPQPEAD